MKKSPVPTLAILVLSGFTGFAQVPGAGSPAGVNATLTKLFGNVTAFSARSEVQVLDKDRKEKVSTPMNFALLDNKIRVEIDMTQMKNKDLPASAAASLK